MSIPSDGGTGRSWTADELYDSLQRWRKMCSEATEQLADSRLHGREADVRIKELERTLAAIIELDPASPAAIRVAQTMAKRAMGRGEWCVSRK